MVNHAGKKVQELLRIQKIPKVSNEEGNYITLEGSKL